jgi:hypothetical protein
MTFGLKNAGAMYQRAMNYIFHDLISKLVEIYIDDVVVKSASVEGHLEDLRQVLERTRRFGLRMNPKKCAFGISAGQFLDFLVHERGIEIGLKVKKLCAPWCHLLRRGSSSSSLVRSTLLEGLFPISLG